MVGITVTIALLSSPPKHNKHITGFSGRLSPTDSPGSSCSIASLDDSQGPAGHDFDNGGGGGGEFTLCLEPRQLPQEHRGAAGGMVSVQSWPPSHGTLPDDNDDDDLGLGLLLDEGGGRSDGPTTSPINSDNDSHDRGNSKATNPANNIFSARCSTTIAAGSSTSSSSSIRGTAGLGATAPT